MGLREKGPYEEEYELHVLIEKEEKFWLKELEKITSGNRERLLTLEHLLDDAYAVRQPKQREYRQRKELVLMFNRIARELYCNSADYPVVEEFGSFSMGLFTSESDLDLSINFSNSANVSSRHQFITTLRRFKKKLYALKDEGLVSDILPILNAKVPVLKLVDVASGIECDLSVENRDGISKSKIIYLISSLDERFQKLCILMKVWAKAHGVNSPKDGTLSSLSIVLLVAFHLQTRDPPIFPPFSAILKEFIVDGEDLKNVKRYVEHFKNYGRRNTESLGELFVSFLIKLASVKQIWPKGLCASPYHGRWIYKTWTRTASISVEDFTDHTQNVARAVGSKEANVIFDHIILTIRSLDSFMNGHIDESNLKETLFGNAGISRNIVQTVMINKPKESRNQHDMKINSLQNRKGVVTSDGWEVSRSWTTTTTTTRPPTFGYWRPKQNQEMSSSNDPTPETPQAMQQPVMPIDHLESTKNNAQGSERLRFGELPEATKSWGETGIGDWGGLGNGQGWEEPSSYYNGCWDGFRSGAYFPL